MAPYDGNPAEYQPETKPDLSELLATPVPFRAWLESKQLDAEIGLCGRAQECAIAAYLSEHGRAGLYMTRTYKSQQGGIFDGVWCGGGKLLFPAPAWVDEFAKGYDGDNVYPAPYTRTAADCLRILDQIEAL